MGSGGASSALETRIMLRCATDASTEDYEIGNVDWRRCSTLNVISVLWPSHPYELAPTTNSALRVVCTLDKEFRQGFCANGVFVSLAVTSLSLAY